MRAALRAEWTKLWTVAGPCGLLLGLIVATIGLSAAAGAVVTCASAGCDPLGPGLVGVRLGQAPAAVLAVLMISGEYSSGLIRTTLTAVPRRPVVLAAKAVVLAGVVAVAATIAVLGSLAAAGTTARPGDGTTLRVTGGSILYLVLIALLGLGVAAVVRDSATSVGVILGLVYLFPVIAQVIGDPHWQRVLQRIAPMSAGLTVQATGDLGGLPLSPWAGLAVTAGWAAAALVAGGLVLHFRDA
ncbi:ABC transporter permease subunit [Actinoplanes friuliensis]|uniref:ABC transporter permease n=1 Tax=Actinoplanes friuliensis DSM 7358 TaxID=1246995 RepID=U5VZZ3_9ACTN|nr:ABC transporter permease subunit [Actinoplanes friuliensis]AGZ41295.1 hypothetical protein AFR_15065 [Actinoplanes friuliensis DSM 7358]